MFFNDDFYFCYVLVLALLISYVTGNRVLHTCILHLHCGSIDSRNSQLKQLNSLIQKFDVRTIAVGDGVAARETEMVLSHILNEENASDVVRYVNRQRHIP